MPEGTTVGELVLGIDTSTQVAVGLARDGEVIDAMWAGDSRSHVELLMPTIEALLRRSAVTLAQVSAIAVGMGPGPFTGLRVGIAAAEMLAGVGGIPLRRVCSLDVIGVGWALTSPLTDFVACTDARRKELYWAVYNPYGQRTAGPYVSVPGSVRALPCVGPGTLVYPQAGGGMDSFLAIKLGVRVDRFASQWPRLEDVGPIAGINAGVLAAYAEQLPDAGPEPLYLRHADAAVSKGTKSVLPGTGRDRS
jgi:tRNA threonylcarbamoyl adenosine modification protein YeaZ